MVYFTLCIYLCLGAFRFSVCEILFVREQIRYFEHG